MNRSLVTFPTLAAGVFLIGACDSRPKPFDVSGTVTYKGELVPAGVIQIDPDLANGHDGPQGYAHLKEGKFNTAERGRGIKPGPHVVRVQGFDGVVGNELPLGNRLFPDYESTHELKPGGPPLVIEVPAVKK